MCENMNHLSRVLLRNCRSWQSCGISLTYYHPLKHCCWPSTPRHGKDSPPRQQETARHNANYPRNVTKLKTSTSPPNPPPRSQSDWGSVGCTRTRQVHQGPTSDWTWICLTRWDIDKGPLEVLCRVCHLGFGFESCGIWGPPWIRLTVYECVCEGVNGDFIK